MMNSEIDYKVAFHELADDYARKCQEVAILKAKLNMCQLTDIVDDKTLSRSTLINKEEKKEETKNNISFVDDLSLRPVSNENITVDNTKKGTVAHKIEIKMRETSVQDNDLILMLQQKAEICAGIFTRHQLYIKIVYDIQMFKDNLYPRIEFIRDRYVLQYNLYKDGSIRSYKYKKFSKENGKSICSEVLATEFDAVLLQADSLMRGKKGEDVL